MPLASVLVDRARLQRKADSGVKVAGRTTFVDSEPGTWFAARLVLPNATAEQIPAGFISRRVVLVPTLIFDTEDDEGSEVEVRFNDMLEVESDDLGATTWEVTAEPQAFRKREGVIAFSTTLKRIETHDFARRAP